MADSIRPYVAVVGAGAAGDAESHAAEEIGRELGRRGAVVVCGGLGGVMAAACRGARAEGATTVGILPGDDRRAANEWVDVAVATGMGEARNALVVRAADAVVAVGGEFGTLSEIALALKLGKPVVGVGTWAIAPPGAVHPPPDASSASPPPAAPDAADDPHTPDAADDPHTPGDPIVRVADPATAARTALDLVR